MQEQSPSQSSPDPSTLEEPIIQDPIITDQTRTKYRGSKSPLSEQGKSSRSRSKSIQPQTSPSTKSDSDSQPHRKYRRDRTLKRNPSFRDFGEEDIKYLWLLHKKSHPKPLLPDQFRDEFIDMVWPNYHVGWVLETVVKGDRRPVGIFFGNAFGPLLMLADMFWLPWASNRNKIEAAVKFLQEMRKSTLMVFTSTLDDKHFYEYIAKHGILRRVGTIIGIYDEPAAFFQTRPL